MRSGKVQSLKICTQRFTCVHKPLDIVDATISHCITFFICTHRWFLSLSANSKRPELCMELPLSIILSQKSNWDDCDKQLLQWLSSSQPYFEAMGSLVVSKLKSKSESENLDKSYCSPYILDPELKIQAPLPSTSTPKVSHQI